MRNAKPDHLAAEPLDQAHGRPPRCRRSRARRRRSAPARRARPRRGGSRAGRCRTRARTPRARSPTAACPALRTGTNPARELVRDRRREHEAPGLDAERPCRSAARRTAPRARRPIAAKASGVGEQRRDVLEDDARLRDSRGCRGRAPCSQRRVHPDQGTGGPAAGVLGRYLRLRPRCWRGRGAAWIGARGRPRAGRGRRRRRHAARGSSSSAGRRRTGTPVDTDAAAERRCGGRRSCERLVLRLPLLPPREQRRRDEDRRVRTDEQTGGEREREVLERGRAEDAASRRSAARAPAAARRASSRATASAPRSATGSTISP